MIKVRFYTDDRDVCSIMEENLTGGIEIEDWLMQRMDGISFDSMDYPCDMEFCYDCYFQSDADELKAREIYGLLEISSLDRMGVRRTVWVTDHSLNEEIKITGR